MYSNDPSLPFWVSGDAHEKSNKEEFSKNHHRYFIKLKNHQAADGSL